MSRLKNHFTSNCPETNKPLYLHELTGKGSGCMPNLNPQRRDLLEPVKLTPQSLETFLNRPGINIAGICSETGVSVQYLNRCRKAGQLPSEKICAELLRVIRGYGFQG